MRHPHQYWLHRHPLDWLICDRYYDSFKRGLDIILCLMMLPFVLVLISLLAVLVLIDSPGKPIYTQWRTGKNGRRFPMYKLRTMVRNAEELKQKYAEKNELVWPDFKLKDDPRVTRIGHILRKTSLDELPQVLNVLKGDMSFIGPRPTSFPASTYALWQTQRLDTKPGLSGLWQVKGRAALLFDERCRLEIHYVQQPCLLTDLELIWETAASVLQRKGAF